MKLMTVKIEKSLPRLYSTDDVPCENKVLLVKYFTPDSDWTWYVAEGNKLEHGDWLFFGRVDGFVSEWGQFRLSDLEEVTGPMGLRVERDRHFTPMISEKTRVMR